MSNSRFPTSRLLWAVVAVLCVTSGCASFSGTSEKWAASWKKRSQPKPVDPNHEEIVTYWGMKKKEPKPSPISAEMKARLAQNSDPQQRLREYAEQFKSGNQRLKEGRLEEARRAYEQALAAKPNDPDVHHRLAVVADKQQMFGVADDHYEAALRQRPRDPSLLSDIGYSNLLRGDDRRAEATLREALSIDPSHEGAMLNLGTLYGKQGRYEETLALFRRGTTDAKTNQYMAQLFPQGPPAGVTLASGQADPQRRSAPLMPADESPRLDRMSNEQLKSELERRQRDGGQSAPSQFAQINPQRDWTGDALRADSGSLPQEARVNGGLNSQPWNQGPTQGNPSASAQNSGQPWANSTANSIGTPMAAQPTNPATGQPPFVSGGPASNGSVWNGPVQQQGYAAQPQSRGPLAAPPGTSPHSNMEFWQGKNVPANNGTPVNNAGFSESSTSSQFNVEQMSHTQSDPAGASRAAAQLGMSAGPGSLFPVVIGNPATASDVNRQPSAANGSAYDSRFGGEFAQPPQYQNPSHFTAPTGPSRQNQIQLLGGDGAASNSAPQNWPGTASRSGGSAQQRFDGNDAATSSSSDSAVPMVAGNLPHPWEGGSNTGSNVFQAGSNSPWNSSESRASDPLDSFESGANSGRKSRYAKTPWNDPNAEPLGSRPYNGAWPNSNLNSTPAPANTGGASNSLPMWNGGNSAGATAPNQPGPAAGGTASGAPPQWPYSTPR